MLVTCPDCGLSRDVNDDRIPAGASLAICPRCNHRFVFRDVEGDDEAFIFDTDDAPGTAAAKPDTALKHTGVEAASKNFHNESQAAFPPIDVPWEHLDTYGFFGGLFRTIKLVVLNAPTFFRSMSARGGYWRPLSFAAIVFFGASVIVLALEQLFGIQFRLLEQSGLQPVPPDRSELLRGWLMSLAGNAIAFAPGAFFGAGVTHLLLVAVRAGNAGFRATFRALCYAYAPFAFGVIPVIGAAVGAVWGIPVFFMALKNVHGTSYLRVLSIVPLGLFILSLAAGLMAALHG